MKKIITLMLLTLLFILFGTEQCFAEDDKDSLQNEFMEVYLSTRDTPFIGTQEQAWNWACDQVRYFRQKGLEEDMISFLEANMIQFLPEAYIAHFDDFFVLVDGVNSVIIACEERYNAGDAKGANYVIEPWIQNMDDHPETYTGGKYCLSSPAEVALFMMDTGIMDFELTDLNYTALILEYCKVLNVNAFAAEKYEIMQKYLRIASELSPCNARVWEALARLNTNQRSTYIEKALLYSVDEAALASVYADLALEYAANNKHELADALCTLCEQYGGDALAARFVLSHLDYEKPADYEAVIQAAGIQIGFSDAAKSAIKIANS